MQDDNFTEAKIAYNNQQLALGLYPIVPLRNMIVCPQLIISLFVGREQSIKTINENKNKQILFLLQKDPKIDDPKQGDFHNVGTIAKVLHVSKLPDKSLKVTIEGQSCVIVDNITEDLQGEVRPFEQEADETGMLFDAKRQVLKASFTQYLKLKKQYTPDLVDILADIEDPFVFLDFISIHTDIDHNIRQKMLSEPKLSIRFALLAEALGYDIENIKLSNQISQDVKNQFESHHKKILLAAKLEATRKALEALDGGEETPEAEFDAIKKQIKETKLTPEAKEKAEKELKKLRNMNGMSSEATVIRNYLDWLLALPWGKSKKVKYDLNKAREELDKNHYGLKKIKERIYEMIAVESRVGVARAPILCLYGPPGVGKTSLARSIADATNREFISVSLGGLNDEAEIRGHRSTYIGAKPGKIIQGLRRAKTDNPVFLLDEIGEIGQDPRGNPAAALLEVLDPEHRSEFRDNFLEVAWPFDKAMVVASTNRLDTLPPALVDRMEIISLSGYTEEEKLHIAKNHLVAKQKKANGLADDELVLTDDALMAMISDYTKEAGVRSLERQIAKVCRKVVVKNSVAVTDSSDTEKHAKSKKTKATSTVKHLITVDNLADYLGTPRYSVDKSDLKDKIGVASGLAWTQVGGEILYIEASATKGNGKITITGKLGDVMKESVYAAWSVVKSKAEEYNLEDLEKVSLHVHVPEGATPKDGPSAGVAITLSILSAVTRRPLRGTVAMTGEINLQGKVLPIGGLKEKILAAISNKIDTVMIPKANAHELQELAEEIHLDKINVLPIDSIDEAIKCTLV